MISNIYQDVVQIFDAYGRAEYTGKFVRTWARVGSGAAILIGMERLP